MLSSVIASLCGSLKVKLKNNVFTHHGYWQGTYQLSSTVNGRPSWTTESYAIRYLPNDKVWGIGKLEDIGNTISGITSVDDNEVDDPQHMLSWNYYSGDEWVVPDEKNDIIVECIDGM